MKEMPDVNDVVAVALNEAYDPNGPHVVNVRNSRFLTRL